MGKYSIHGSPAFDKLVDQHMQRIADEVWTSSYSKHWKALVLIGGYGRGEGTPLIEKNGEEAPFNDYDLVVVTNRTGPLIRGALKHLEKRLTAEIGLPVELCPYLKRNLPKCEFSLLNYEMKYGHKVIRGNEKILKRMPNYPHNQIPLSEGTRLLMNRGKLLLEAKQRLTVSSSLTAEERRKFIKFILKANLAFGDCALLMRKAYDTSYAIKKERIKDLDLSGLDDARDIVNAYLRAIELKEGGNFRTLETVNIHMWLNEAMIHFQKVFLWHEQRVLNRKFRDANKYADAFPHLGNEGSPLKNAVHNLRTFGFGALPHLFVHPRIRLYAVIAPLLTGRANLNKIRGILCSQEGTFDGLCDNFIRIQQHFS